MAVDRPRVDQRSLTRALGLGAIVGLIYCSVSGGPYGLEGVIGESGAGMGLLLILVTPFIVGLPTALLTAELGTAMPVEGGYYHWVKTGMGPFAGFLEGWWNWVCRLGRPGRVPRAVRRVRGLLPAGAAR